MHFVSVIEIFLENCIKSHFIKATLCVLQTLTEDKAFVYSFAPCFYNYFLTRLVAISLERQSCVKTNVNIEFYGIKKTRTLLRVVTSIFFFQTDNACSLSIQKKITKIGNSEIFTVIYNICEKDTTRP